MKYSTILYFCDCYLITIQYDETIDEIITQFVEGERDENITELKEDYERLLSLENEVKLEDTKAIVEGMTTFAIEPEIMLEIIETIYSRLC